MLVYKPLGKLVLGLLFLVVFLLLGAKYANAGCSGQLRCVGKDIYGVCNTTLYSSLGCGGALTPAQCASTETTFATACEDDGKCYLGACNWTDTCGDGYCAASEVSSCAADCGAPPCVTGTWTNQGCGNNGCAATAMYQTRTTNPAGCNSTWRCDGGHASCAAPPPQCTTPNPGSSGSCSAGNLTLSYSWPSVSGATSYRVQISTSSTFSSYVVNTTTASTSYSTTQPGGTYYFRVQVATSSGTCTSPSAWSAVRTISNSCSVVPPPPTVPPATATPLPPPTCTTPNSSSSGSCSAGNLTLSYSWPSVSGASSYRVQIATDPSFPSASMIVNTTTSGTSYSTTRPGGTYYFRVQVATSSGTCTSPSAWSAVRTISNSCSVVPPPPTVPPPPPATNTPIVTSPPVATNTPTPIPCTISAAILSPSSATLNVGSGATFSLSVNASPSGCTNDAFFVRSNSNISITSANPDTTAPYTVNVYCNAAGTANISGQARLGGVSQASDTSAVTCSALPTSAPTATPAPGQCAGVGLSGSGSCSGSTLNLSYSWGASAGASNYRRQISTNSGFTNIIADSTGTGTSFSSSQPGGTYYARVRVEGSSGTCAAPSNWSNAVAIANNCGVFATLTPTSAVPTLTPTPPPPPASITANPVVLYGVGTQGEAVIGGGPFKNPVSFVISGPGGVATIAPNDADGAAVWRSTVTAIGIGTTQYTVVATDLNDNIVTAVGEITVNNPQAWTQAGSGDIVAKGNIQSIIPVSCTINPLCNLNLITNQPSQNPGIAIAGGSIDPGFGQISTSNQRITGNSTWGPIYDIDYFINKIAPLPKSSVPGSFTIANLPGSPDYQNWHIVNIPCPATVSGNFDLLTRKTILIANCPGTGLNINGPINVTDGQGAAIVIVNGNINVGPGVGGANDTTPDLEGLYFCSGSFNTPTNPDPTINDLQLHVRGSVACNSFNLERDLEDNSAQSSEKFEFAPDQYMLYPNFLSGRKTIWREVAP